MRKLKFRAWCEGEHQSLSFETPYMDYEPCISHEGEYLHIKCGEVDDILPTIPIMQYIGYNDKDGKEIYEEDLVAMYYFSDPELYSIGRIFWDEEIMCYAIDHPIISRLKGCELKVIGNMFENPELVNDLRLKEESTNLDEWHRKRERLKEEIIMVEAQIKSVKNEKES